MFVLFFCFQVTPHPAISRRLLSDLKFPSHFSTNSREPAPSPPIWHKTQKRLHAVSSFLASKQRSSLKVFFCSVAHPSALCLSFSFFLLQQSICILAPLSYERRLQAGSHKSFSLVWIHLVFFPANTLMRLLLAANELPTLESPRLLIRRQLLCSADRILIFWHHHLVDHHSLFIPLSFSLCHTNTNNQCTFSKLMSDYPGERNHRSKKIKCIDLPMTTRPSPDWWSVITATIRKVTSPFL